MLTDKQIEREEAFCEDWYMTRKMEDWDLFQVPEKDVANKWDGHSPGDVARRIRDYVLGK